MPTITVKDRASIFYKDWGIGQPIVFSHGWPLSSDDWVYPGFPHGMATTHPHVINADILAFIKGEAAAAGSRAV
jgi:pimeloyl-ACP methyl ester carboxylesterase